VQNCVGGMSQSCSPGTPSPETCNGIDDNCDGIVDNVVCPVVPNANGTCNGVMCTYACDPGYADCNGNPTVDGCEVNVLIDTANCGGCGLVCSGTCVSGVCQQPNGSACAMSANCQSGNCVDNVCCNTACAGTCQACVAAQTGGVNGTCANITAGTDPGNECLGAQTCNGAGACL
jgi:hypothetical protein